MHQDAVFFQSRQYIPVDLEREYDSRDRAIENFLYRAKEESIFTEKYTISPTLLDDIKGTTHDILMNRIVKCDFEKYRIWRSVVALKIEMAEFKNNLGAVEYRGKLILKVFNVEKGKIYRNIYLLRSKKVIDISKDGYDQERSIAFMNGVHERNEQAANEMVEEIIARGMNSKLTFDSISMELEETKEELQKITLQKEAAEDGMKTAVEKSNKYLEAIEKANAEGNNEPIIYGDLKVKELNPEIIKKVLELVRQYLKTVELEDDGKMTVETIEGVLIQKSQIKEFNLDDFELTFGDPNSYESPFVARELIKYLVENGINFSEDFLEDIED